MLGELRGGSNSFCEGGAREGCRGGAEWIGFDEIMNKKSFHVLWRVLKGKLLFWFQVV